MYILKIDSQKQDLSNRNCHLQIPMSNSVLHLFVGQHGKKRPNNVFLILTCKSLGADGSTAMARYKTWRRFFWQVSEDFTDSWWMCYGFAYKKYYLCACIDKNQEKIIHAIFWMNLCGKQPKMFPSLTPPVSPKHQCRQQHVGIRSSTHQIQGTYKGTIDTARPQKQEWYCICLYMDTANCKWFYMGCTLDSCEWAPE